MAKEFWGAIASKGSIEVTYKWASADGSVEKVKRKDSGFTMSVQDARDALIAAADALTEDLDDVRTVQVYTGRTDPDTGGAIVDIVFKDGSSMRIGDDEPVPAALAEARDAFKRACREALKKTANETIS